MNADRFQHLADAYGGDPRRWPEAERAAGQAYLAEAGVDAERLLFEARQIDAMLDQMPSVKVSHELRERVIALAAPGLMRLRPRFRFDPLAWFSGAGVAAACAAGILVGVNITSQATADLRADAVLYQASLGGVDDTEVLG